MKPRAVLYARVSTSQQERDGVSLDTQQQMASRVCEARGWDLVGTYTDVMSGKADGRPQLRQLSSDARARPRPFDLVLVYRNDRLARSVRKLYEVVGAWRDAGVSLVSLTEEFDLTTPAGKAMFGMLGIFAEFESDANSTRVTDNMRQLAAGGQWLGGPLPLGYAWVDGKLVVVEAEAATVRAAFAAFIEERTMRAACQRLNAAGHVTKAGGPFVVAAYRKLLRNPVYVGDAAWGKTGQVPGTRRRRALPAAEWIVAKAGHEAVIPREVWAAAQALLVENAAKPGRLLDGQRRFAWSGLFRCAGCGLGMPHLPADRKRPGSRGAYACNRFQTGGVAACPAPAKVGEAFLDAHLVPAVGAALAEAATAYGARPAKAKASGSPRQRERVLRELAERRERELELFRGGLTTFEAMKARLASLDAQAAAATAGPPTATPGPLLPPMPPHIGAVWPDLGERERGRLLRGIIDHAEVSGSEVAIVFRQFSRADGTDALPPRLSVPKVDMRGRAKRRQT